MADLPKDITSLPADPVAAMFTNTATADKQTTDLQAQEDASNRALREQKQAAINPIQQQRQAAGKDVGAMMEKGPDQVALPKNEAHHMDPKQMSDSAGLMMALAGLAGAMIRAPITVALKGMTGAMQGIQAADDEQFQEGYRKYQDNMKEAIQLNDEKLKAYDRVLKGKEFNLREMDAELTTIAQKYDDQILLNSKDFKTKMDHIQAQTEANRKNLDSLNKNDQWKKDYDLKVQEAARKKEATSGGTTPHEGTRAATYEFLINGVSPPKRGGEYMAVMRDLDSLAKENHMTTEQLISASADVKSRLMAKRSFEIRAQNMTRAENQLSLEIPVLEGAMTKIAPPDSPLFASLDLGMIRKGGGSKEQRAALTQMDQAAETVFNEFEGIITGNPGALNVSDVQTAHENYKKAQAPTELKAAIDGMKRIIANAKTAGDKTRKEIMGGVSDAIGGQSTGEGAQQHPTKNTKGWTLHRNKKTGEQAYIGPNGEIEKVQ